MAIPFKYYILNEQEIESGALDLRYYTKTQADGKYVLKETGKQLIESTILADLTDGGNTTLHKHDDKADKLFATNLVTNGDFSNGTTGWGLNGSTISAANNILSITGNGATASVGTTTLSSIAYASGKKIYSRGKVRVTNSNSNRLSIILFDGSNYYVCAQQTTIINGTWYDISGITTLLAGGNKLEVMPQHRYVDAATSNGKVMEVQYVLALDLTTLFGAGNEPTKEQIDRLLSIYPNSWFNGTQEITNIKQVFNEKADRLFATNLVTNGDFSNGTTGWFGNLGTISNVNNELNILANANIGGATQNNISLISGNKYYFSGMIKGQSSFTARLALDNQASPYQNFGTIEFTVSTSFQRKSQIVQQSLTVSTGAIRIRDARSSGFDTFYADNILLINLTALFGTGNEPTKEQMDWIFTERDRLGLGHLNGTQELLPMVSLLNLINKKADSTQVAFITATLLAGATGTLKYRKNSINQIEVSADVTVGTGTSGTTLATLPTGYRLTYQCAIRGYNRTANTGIDLQLDTSGNLVLRTAVTTGQVISINAVLNLGV